MQKHFQANLSNHRSRSMPNINKVLLPQPIHNVRRESKKSLINIEESQQHPLPIISLSGINNKEEEELTCKIKVLAERSMKKLQEKYETIDRWKQKYIPESMYQQQASRPKFNFNQVFPPIEQKQNLDEPVTPQPNTAPEKASKLLPIIAKQPINQQIPDYRDQSKKLEEELMARLQKNKRYYQMKNSQRYKEINYFKNDYDMSVEKRRDFDVKNIIKAGAKKNKLLSILHKKMSSPNPEIGLFRKKGPAFNLFQEPVDKKLKLKKSQSIHEFKEELLMQAVQQVPEGWDIPSEPNSPEMVNEEQSVE